MHIPSQYWMVQRLGKQLIILPLWMSQKKIIISIEYIEKIVHAIPR